VISDSVWSEVIKEADKDSDGTIDFDEFKKLMFKMLNKTN